MHKDNELKKLNKKEEKRQLETLTLIASENYTSLAVREAHASVLGNKYSEGYPEARYYPGNEVVDEIETLCQKRALELFKLSPNIWSVNVQPYSGSPANFAVYGALLSKDDVALGMTLSGGGHLTHGHKASFSGKFFNFVQYGLDEKGYINYEEVERLAKKHKPKLIVVGISAYSRKINFKKFKDIAKKHNAILMADISHIAGLVAGGQHPSPFPYCGIVTTTTHKTLRGPRGAMILSRKEYSATLNKAVFPGLQGGPHNNTTAALATALKEASSPAFKKYAKQVVVNSKTLAKELKNKGYTIVSEGTDNHLFLVDLQDKMLTGGPARHCYAQALSGGDAERILERNGVTANRNAIPNDPRKPFNPSGIRIGTPAVTTRGMREKEMVLLAELIDKALKGENVSSEVKKLALKFKPPGF